MERAVFLDRDGTLGGDGWYCRPDKFTLFPESIPAIKLLNEKNFKVIVITNQTHIGHGEITIEQVNASFERIQAQLRGHGARLDGWYICPHISSDQCECRKPSPYMIFQAVREFNIDVSRSFMVGDSGVSDIGTGVAAGCKTALVLTGLGKGSMSQYRHEWQHIEPDYVANNVLQAVAMILGDGTI